MARHASPRWWARTPRPRPRSVPWPAGRAPPHRAAGPRALVEGQGRHRCLPRISQDRAHIGQLPGDPLRGHRRLLQGLGGPLVGPDDEELVVLLTRVHEAEGRADGHVRGQPLERVLDALDLDGCRGVLREDAPAAGVADPTSTAAMAENMERLRCIAPPPPIPAVLSRRQAMRPPTGRVPSSPSHRPPRSRPGARTSLHWDLVARAARLEHRCHPHPGSSMGGSLMFHVASAGSTYTATSPPPAARVGARTPLDRPWMAPSAPVAPPRS